MTTEEALSNLKIVVSEFKTEGKNHVILQQSLAVLDAAIRPAPQSTEVPSA